MLISELCFPTHRGKYTSLFWTCYYFGAILAAWSTYGTQKHMGDRDWAWRAPSILQAAYPIIQLIFWVFLPEASPSLPVLVALIVILSSTSEPV